MQRGTTHTKESRKLMVLAQKEVTHPKLSEKTKELMSKLRKEWWKQRKLSKEQSV